MSRLLSVVLIALVSGCSAHGDSAGGTRARRSEAGEDTKLANLKRAARLPWKDDGRCAVQESSAAWVTLVERCYDALDRTRIRFVDQAGTCAVAQAGVISADQAVRLLGICLLVQPELAVGAVIVIGVVVVAAAIAAEIEAAERTKKSGCYCYCLKEGRSPYIDFGRVASPAACAKSCAEHEDGFTGSICR